MALHPIEKKAWILHRTIAVVAFIGFVWLVSQASPPKIQEGWIAPALAFLLVLRLGVEMGYGYAAHLRRQQKQQASKASQTAD